MSSPEMRITLVDGEEFLATPENTQLYEYTEDNAHYNHIFSIREKIGNRAIGMYFRPFEEDYDKMRDYMIETDYPTHFSIREVSDDDVANYDNAIENMTDDTDTVPAEWL